MLLDSKSAQDQESYGCWKFACHASSKPAYAQLSQYNDGEPSRCLNKSATHINHTSATAGRQGDGIRDVQPRLRRICPSWTGTHPSFCRVAAVAAADHEAPTVAAAPADTRAQLIISSSSYINPAGGGVQLQSCGGFRREGQGRATRARRALRCVRNQLSHSAHGSGTRCCVSVSKQTGHCMQLCAYLCVWVGGAARHSVW